MAALALHDALCDCAPRLGPLFKLKWPNDVLLGPDKLAGILIEGESEPIFAAVIGFGVNCSSHPPGTAFPATDLLASGAVVAPDGLLAALSVAMLRRLAQWQGGEGFAAFATTGWRAPRGSARTSACACRNARCAVVSTASTKPGGCRSRQPGGLTAVTAGEVFGLGGT